MKNKEWYENIPEQGILCRQKDNNAIILIVESDSPMVYDGYGCSYLEQELNPITPDEWWKFAPYQNMLTAPKDSTEILLISALGDKGICYWRDDEVMTGWTWGLGKSFTNPIAWLPLPDKSS